MTALQMKPSVAAAQSGTGYSWEIKQDVVHKMLTLGNQRLVSKLTGVAYETISSWKKQLWYKELVSSLQQEHAVVLDTKISAVIDKSLDIVQDRLENGEIVLNNKTGALVRKEVSMKDAAKVSNDLLQRQHILRKQETTSDVKEESMKEVLSSLAKEFAKWAKKDYKPSDDAEDIPFVERDT
jgi:hypothetical protein